MFAGITDFLLKPPQFEFKITLGGFYKFACDFPHFNLSVVNVKERYG